MRLGLGIEISLSPWLGQRRSVGSLVGRNEHRRFRLFLACRNLRCLTLGWLRIRCAQCRGRMKDHDESVIAFVTGLISRARMRTSYALQLQYSRHKNVLYKGFVIGWKFIAAFVIVMLVDQYYISPRAKAYTARAIDSIELSKTNDIYTSPLLKVRPSNKIDNEWVKAYENDGSIEKLESMLGNVAAHNPERFYHYMNVTEKERFDNYCTVPDELLPEKDKSVLNERGIFLNTELAGDIAMDFDTVVAEMNRLSGAKIRIFSSPSQCCFACSAVRSCNLWTFCPLENDMGDPTTCAGQCILKYIEDPSMKAVNHPGSIKTEFTPHTTIEQQGIKIPWISGVLDKAYVPDEVKFETGTSGLVRRIALPLLREDKGKPPIIIDLLPERSPMSARYIADILKMQEQTGLDGCLECALTSREDLTGVFGVLHGAMVPLGKSPPMSNEQLSETEAEKDLSRWDVVWVPDSNGRATTEFWIIMDGDKRKTKRHDEIVWGRINDKLSRGRLGEIWKIDVFSEKPYHRDRKSKPATEMDEAIRHGGAHVYKWKLAENYDFSVTAAK